MSSSSLPAVDASLNATACVLLCAGLFFIKRGARRAHALCMIAAAVTSAGFLTCYLYYHFQVVPRIGHTAFRGTGLVRNAYLALLLSHVSLAVLNVPLVGLTLLWAARRNWERHRRIARITWPVWLYVSVTGVLVYFVLYRWNPAG